MTKETTGTGTKTLIPTKKLVLSALFIAFGVATSTLLVFPIGASKCAPVQHFINVCGAVILGPGYAVINAFLISLIRFILGTGSLLAFPGSMIGAALAGILYMLFKKDIAAFVGEVFGTSVLGGICAYFVAKLFLSSDSAAVFGYVLPFFVSTIVGSIIAYLVIKQLRLMKVLKGVMSDDPR
ncbi:energy coupling factor transporter S component ThiW [Catenibacillus scindens]|uniref:Energy coupling factor transporter S component ThiW n=1 Tax=Catenibacillus scindens TaxID=673271 RepID=A0A7W8HDG8_9FIRM|nr:energy coupling factor transporter S component ThiW [Catenibacillus scindens]MBB5265953.1 energy coupling factor transporter S component ThiW [Catenibacillus scindens]